MSGRQRTYARKAQILEAEVRARVPRPSRILEVGCGGGHFTRELALRAPGSTLVATDVFEPMLQACSDRVADLPNVEVRPFELAALQSGEPFDVVCAVDVIHHLAEPALTLRAWRSLVRAGAALILIEANPLHPVLALQALPKPEERRFFLNSPRRLSRWASDAGWRAVTVQRAPLYLPSGPSIWADSLDRLEQLIHRAMPLRMMSGAFLLTATV